MTRRDMSPAHLFLPAWVMPVVRPQIQRSADRAPARLLDDFARFGRAQPAPGAGDADRVGLSIAMASSGPATGGDEFVGGSGSGIDCKES